MTESQKRTAAKTASQFQWLKPADSAASHDLNVSNTVVLGALYYLFGPIYRDSGPRLMLGPTADSAQQQTILVLTCQTAVKIQISVLALRKSLGRFCSFLSALKALLRAVDFDPRSLSDATANHSMKSMYVTNAPLLLWYNLDKEFEGGQ